ncbi:TetR/AcrR family transcriptional regulator [Phenylobacterium sp.]|uniref:TetR/AcrR family transcriptional regulator n=1 Tax=Phenylobacterium sp. TaxID=1871053 RepID=UPI0025F6D793|nr:TetR/AcrR family transcriptional regulator [Phenylobacterium sp.]
MARTRAQIADAAVTLFGERGYDATTLEEVAERADVHKRTLLRYFPTKAHLVLHYQYAALDEFRELMAGRGERSTLEVWTGHVVFHARRMMERGQLANTRQIARGEPAVGPAYLAIQAAYQDLLAEGLAADLGGRPDGAILSKVAAAALAGGNYAVGAMVASRGSYADLERAELEVVRLVRTSLLGGM